MDTAQKLLKNPAILLVLALLMAAPGWAQTLVAPSAVTIGNTGSASISVTSSAGGTSEITFIPTVPHYSGDTSGSRTGWLTVDPGVGPRSTPTNLTFSIGTTAGVYPGASATVTLTPTSPSGVAAVTITVTFSGSGGGGGGTLTASPSPVYMSTALNGTTAPTTISISTAGSTALTIASVSTALNNGTYVNWLGASIANAAVSPGSPGSITVTGYSSGLATGNYTGTVTVTPSVGAPLVINVNLSVGTGGGTGNWTISPTSIAWTFTTSSGIFPTQLVSVTPPTGASSYNVTTTSSNGWLLSSVGGIDGTFFPGVAPGTQFTLKVTSQANALTAGQYTGQAALVDSINNQFTLTVTLTVNGGNAPGLTITPNPATFTAALNTAQQSTVVTVTSNVGGAVTVGPVGTPPGPSVNPVLANQSSTFTVSVNPSGLTAGTYSASIAVAVGTQSGTLTVNFVVGGGGSGGGTGTTAVAPLALNFSHHLGSNLPVVPQKLVVTGPEGAWSSAISNGTPWLRFAPGGGSSLPNPAISGDIPTVSIDPAGLAAGTYSGNISITTAGGTQVVTVSLSVLSSAILLPNPGTLVFNAQTGQAKPAGQSTYFSDSDSTLNVNSQPISAVANNPWISITTGFGSVSVEVNQTGLSTGVYSGSISVSQTGAANSPIAIPVVLVVNGGGSGGGSFGTLSFSQSPIAFTSVNGSTPIPTVLSVSATAATSFVGTISYSAGSGSWLTVSPLSSVTPANLSVSANPAGLAVGSYGATISFNANGVIQTVGVTLVVTTSGGGNTGNVTVSPTALSFSTQSGSSPAAQSISVSSASGSAGVSFAVQVTAGAAWLTTSANTNPTTSYSFTVGISSSALAPGSYTGNIRILPNGGTTVDIPVTLTITAPSVVSATPTSLTFDHQAGNSPPSPKWSHRPPVPPQGRSMFPSTPPAYPPASTTAPCSWPARAVRPAPPPSQSPSTSPPRCPRSPG
ncbi:MAG: hypothetical protein NTW28_18520 [Candidatus Solibacter sp.]|nr:hypothetical protein [Candidatus Solibacter sp.]